LIISLSPAEEITRYVLHKTQIIPTKEKVRYNVFLPAPNGETSVFRISTLGDEQIWNIGREIVADPQQKSVKGRADFAAARVYDVELSIDPDTTSHELHANIVGWPESRSEKKLIAIKLADKATLKMPPS
jgi:hypothetical protein